MEDQIEIEEDALREFLEDKDFKGRTRFSKWQIDFIIKNIDLINKFDIYVLKSQGFDLFQIRYLLKLFNV